MVLHNALICVSYNRTTQRVVLLSGSQVNKNNVSSFDFPMNGFFFPIDGSSAPMELLGNIK